MIGYTNKKILGMTDIILMTILTNFGIRWLAVAAGMGYVAIGYWITSVLFFVMPLTFMSAHLSKIYPEEGGIYAWTSHVLGDKAGFIVAWLYWINNVFFYSAMLIFLSANLAYFLGAPSLINNPWYLNISVIAIFWLIVFITLYGLKWIKQMARYGVYFGVILPTAVLIIFGFYTLIKFHHSATPWSLHHLLPQGRVIGSLSHLTIIMFALAGIEIIPTFANAVKNVKRDLYLGLLLAAASIVTLYILGTIAIDILLSPTQIKATSGLMQTFTMIGIKLRLPWFGQLAAFLLTFADLAAVCLWLLAPTIMFFKCTPPGILPDRLHQVDQNGTPRNAILFMGGLLTIVVLLTNSLPGVNAMYQVLVLMSTILYFIPYLFLAVIYFKCRDQLSFPGYGVILFSVSIFISVTLGIFFSFAPPDTLVSTHDILVYELELLIGPLLFICAGMLLYRRYENKQKIR